MAHSRTGRRWHTTHDHERDPPEPGHVHEWVDDNVDARDDWARRRRKDIPNDKRLFVLACMDERIPIEEVLGLEAAAGGDVADVDLDPALPELTIGDASIAEWVRMTDDIDEACAAQVAYLEDHPLIPDVPVTGYVYEVESGHLRRPGERLVSDISERV